MNCLKIYRPVLLFRSINPLCCHMCTKSSVTEETSSRRGKDNVLPEEPTTCCMSGCANCVWIEYAEELSKLLSGGSTEARDIILAKVSDPNMRAFLLTELKCLENSKTSDCN